MPRPIAVPAFRPGLITLLAAVVGLFTLVALLVGLTGLYFGLTGGGSASSIALNGLTFLVGLFLGWVAYGLWTGSKSAYLLSFVAALVLVATYWTIGIWGPILGFAMVIYLVMPHVRAWFMK